MTDAQSDRATYGRHGRPAMAYLKRLADIAASTASVFKEDFIKNALRELSVCLVRGNAAIYRRTQMTQANVTGTAIRAGDPVPSAEVQ